MPKDPPTRGSEERIRADLRELTDRTRRLREELRAMVKGVGTKDLTKGTVHVPSWVTDRRAENTAVPKDRRRKR